jgi:hypothetical protein
VKRIGLCNLVNDYEKNAALSSANRRGANGNEKELTAMAADEIKTIQVIGFPMDLGAGSPVC